MIWVHIVAYLCLALFFMHFALYLRFYDPNWCSAESWEHLQAKIFGYSKKHEEEEHGCESHEDESEEPEESDRKSIIKLDDVNF